MSRDTVKTSKLGITPGEKVSIEIDIEKGYWFSYGTTPMGGSDFIKPLSISGDSVECVTANFHDRKTVPATEYMSIRGCPLEKVGMWNFVPVHPANVYIRMAERNPNAIGHRLYQAEQAIEDLTRTGLTPSELETERDEYKRQRDKLREIGEAAAHAMDWLIRIAGPWHDGNNAMGCACEDTLSQLRSAITSATKDKP